MTDTGLQRLVELQKKQAAQQAARNRASLHNKLFSIIRGIPGVGISDHNAFCGSLLAMESVEEQEKAIMNTYGPICLDKVRQLLYQLSSIPAAK